MSIATLAWTSSLPGPCSGLLTTHLDPAPPPLLFFTQQPEKSFKHAHQIRLVSCEEPPGASCHSGIKAQFLPWVPATSATSVS